LSVDLGFQPERAAAVRVDPGTTFSSSAQRDTYYTDVLARVGAEPGTGAAGLTDVLPLAGDRSWEVTARGRVFPRGQFPEDFIRIVSNGYLRR
jgi:hypothetical protein